jgi:hypothetical protein
MMFRNDILSLADVNKDQLGEKEWKKCCPTYGSGYRVLSGLYCDYCSNLYDKEGRVCPNNK